MAKAALDLCQGLAKTIAWGDLKSKVNTYLDSVGRERWASNINNKLFEIMPDWDDRRALRGSPLGRKEDTVLTRLRIGHSFLTHAFLLRNEEPPECHACAAPYTAKHVLVECADFADTRNKYYQVSTLGKLFREIESSKIIGFLKEIGIYSKI